MTENRVPAVSIAVISKGKIVQLKTAGVRNATSGTPADPDTIFGGASLSKPVFAFLVLQLVDTGVLSLDEPLASIVPDFLPKDPQAATVTARLKPATARLWLQPQVRLRQQCFLCIDTTAPDRDQRVAWGLGWGLQPDSGTFFHWGDAGRYMSFAAGSVTKRSGVVVFVNGANGMVIMPDLVAEFMPGDHPAFAWLNYPPHSPPPKAKESKDAKDAKDLKNGKEAK